MKGQGLTNGDELGDGGHFCAKLFNLREKGSLKLQHKDIHHMAARRQLPLVLLHCARRHAHAPYPLQFLWKSKLMSNKDQIMERPSRTTFVVVFIIITTESLKSHLAQSANKKKS